MKKRFVVIWFYHLSTDWFTLTDPALANHSFVLSAPAHGRMVITAANAKAQSEGIHAGMVVADARAVVPSLMVLDDKPAVYLQLLKRLATWCIRFTPFVAIDPPDGLILDVTGCAHLYGGEEKYLNEISRRIKARGYHVRIAMADTIGAAWAIAHSGNTDIVIPENEHGNSLLSLSPAALRLEMEIVERLYKLGMRKIGDFIHMPRAILRRRFGQSFLKKLDQALGNEEELAEPVIPVAPYQERLPCLEPIVTITGIEMALQHLLEALCKRLQVEQMGARNAMLSCYRVDGKLIEVEIATNRPSRNTGHLFKLFEMKLGVIEPALGIELFVLTANKVEPHAPSQEKLWERKAGIEDEQVSELIDRLSGKFGEGHIHRYLPDEHYWPERSFKLATTVHEQPSTKWKNDRPRPLHLLNVPQKIMVTAPIPDYPPMLFRYKGKVHKIIRADGPERIEQEWWLQDGEHRDYYRVEDEAGCRYWLFRSGHYDAEKMHQWFLHGFFA
jgi:protein ImuB